MAVTFTANNKKVFVVGDRKFVLADVSCSGTPTAGGDVFDCATVLGLDLEVTDFDCDMLVKSDNSAAVLTAAVRQTTPSQYKVAFFVQVTAGAANSMAAYTGNTNLGGTASFHVDVIGKGKAAF